MTKDIKLIEKQKISISGEKILQPDMKKTIEQRSTLIEKQKRRTSGGNVWPPEKHLFSACQGAGLLSLALLPPMALPLSSLR
jgi:hypothetical protein